VGAAASAAATAAVAASTRMVKIKKKGGLEGQTTKEKHPWR
jgi:hypothetical protein